MRFLNTIFVALRALRRNALRSVLTALGIIIGVAAVIAMVSLLNGAKTQIETSIANLGQNFIVVFPGNFTAGGARGGWGTASTLTVEDALAIRNEVPGIAALSPEMRDRAQILGNGLNWNTQIMGEDVTFPDIRIWSVASGAMFSDTDVRSAAKVCVVGQTIVKQLFPDKDPLGESLRINNIPFKIVGVLGSKGFNTGNQDQDDVVIIPYTSHLRRIARRPFLSSIIMAVEKSDQMDRVQQDITDLLQQRRNGREPDFTVRNQLQIAETATAANKSMAVLLLIIAGVSLLVGGIGIMNIMLVSVTERTREIGLRLAIGAHGRDVLLQFLTEAIILSLLGGLLGVALGVGSAHFIGQANNWPIQISTFWVSVSFAISGIIGIAFGFFPAFKAAQLDPIEALRYE